MAAVGARSALDELVGCLPSSADLAVVRDGEAVVIALEPSDVIRAGGEDALAALGRLDGGWWAGFCAYDLGRAVERVPPANPPLPGLPDLLLARFDRRLRWHPTEGVSVEGNGNARTLLEGLALPIPTALDPPALGGWRSSLDREHWHVAVTRIIEHLRDGDCYQVNLTRRLTSRETCDPLALFRTLLFGNPAPHAALLRIGDLSVVSLSPELFLRCDGRNAVTRPIKGTSSDRLTLEQSEKDRAENVMIVDLSRNDLGRVCEYASIKVPQLWSVEEHPGLFHLVSTVQGTLRQDVTPGHLIRATFPPASVTGCPKPRVMQIIEELEPVRRGVYCGAVGFIDADRDVIELNVAIRTFTITPEETSFGVGGGIVADSDPASEWEETELKARRLLSLAGGSV